MLCTLFEIVSLLRYVVFAGSLMFYTFSFAAVELEFRRFFTVVLILLLMLGLKVIDAA